MTKTKGVIYEIGTAFLWGSSFVVTKILVDNLPPFLLATVRFFVAAIVLTIICYKKLKLVDKKVICRGAILGLFYALGISLQSLGVMYTSAGRTSFVAQSISIIMPFLELIILKSELKNKILLSALVCLIGVGLISLDNAEGINKGDLFVFASVFCFALQIVLMPLFMKDSDVELLNIFLFAFAGIVALIIGLFVGGKVSPLNMTGILALMYLSVFCTGIPLLMQSKAQSILPPSIITLFNGLQPIFASVMSYFVFGEMWTLKGLIGAALILISIVISLL